MMVTDTRSGPTIGPPRISVAPGDLEIVQRFVNTLDIENGTDEFDSPAGLSGWLAGSGLITPQAAAGRVRPDEVPVFWACGVTPQAIARTARPELLITHKPGHMFVADMRTAV